MNKFIRIEDRLAESLRRLNVSQPVVQVIQGDFGKVMGIVVSPSFEGMGDEKRQHLVWDQVLKTLSPEDQSQIEFIFTNAPSEQPV